MAEQKFVVKMLTVLVLAFPNAKIEKGSIDVYARDLADIPEDVLDLACQECRVTLRFFPTIAEIRDAAAKLQSGVDSLPPAGEAWREFQKMAGDCREMPQDIGNPVLAQTLTGMGWRYLTTSDNVIADRARFIELYNEYAKRRLHRFVETPALADARYKMLMGSAAVRLSAPKHVPRDEGRDV